VEINRLSFAKTSLLAVAGTLGATLTPRMALALTTNRTGSLSLSQRILNFWNSISKMTAR
jgi:hypothetical protein